MNKKFLIQSSNPALLEKATKIATEFVRDYMVDDIVGIVFLGAIARGYFDARKGVAVTQRKGSAATRGEAMADDVWAYPFGVVCEPLDTVVGRTRQSHQRAPDVRSRD